jgi:alkylation response protein AidB-like acyl-CoA dehydrogenase
VSGEWEEVSVNPPVPSPELSFTGSALEQRVEAAAALARKLAPTTERERRLPEELLGELRASGLMRAGAPRTLGALQAPPAVTLACAERIAQGDASAGWCVSIAATSSLLTAYLSPSAAEEILGEEHSVAAGVWAPRGTATAVGGGVRISGRWSFCSGISHSDWLFAGYILKDAQADSGGPVVRVAALPKADLEIPDSWHTSGLRGTGSHDAIAEDVFVPDDHTLSLMEGGPNVDAALYRFPAFGFFALSIAAAALGNARGAIEDLIALAGAKTSLGSSRKLAERPATQAAVAEGEAALRAARALYYQAIEEAWEAAQEPAPVAAAPRLGLRLAATHAVRTAARVTGAMYDLGGGTAIYEDSPLQRRFRDAHTATAHFQVNPASWEIAGRLLLDLPTNIAQL